MRINDGAVVADFELAEGADWVQPWQFVQADETTAWDRSGYSHTFQAKARRDSNATSLLTVTVDSTNAATGTIVTKVAVSAIGVETLPAVLEYDWIATKAGVAEHWATGRFVLRRKATG